MTLGMGSSMHGILQARWQMIGLVPEKNHRGSSTSSPSTTSAGRSTGIFQHPSVGDVVVENEDPHRLQVRDHHHRVDALPGMPSSPWPSTSQNKTEGVLLMMETAWAPTGCASSHKAQRRTAATDLPTSSGPTSGCAWMPTSHPGTAVYSAALR